MLLSEQLKAAIRDSGENPFTIAKGAGVAQPAVWHFLRDDGQHRDIRLERTADKLAAYLGLELAPTRKKKPGHGRDSKRPTAAAPASAPGRKVAATRKLRAAQSTRRRSSPPG